MKRFSVDFELVMWVFIADHEVFPPDFLAFDTSTAPTNRRVVYVTDNIQAMVAYDYLLERDWVPTPCREFQAMLDGETVAA